MSPLSTDTVIDDTDNGKDNPFRPDGGLAREAEIIVELIKAGKPIKATSPTQEDIDELEALRASANHSSAGYDVDYQSNINSPVNTGDCNGKKSNLSSPSKSSQSTSPSNGVKVSPANSPSKKCLKETNNNYNSRDVSIASPKGSLNVDNLDAYALVDEKKCKRHCCSLQ